MKREKVFVSYSHRDEEWLDRLRVHLRPLEREGLIEQWDDTRIMAGGKWQEEIRTALASSKVAVLLVSADFLASDYIATEELPSLLKSAEAEGLVILPVIVSPSRIAKTALAQFQAVNPPSQPLIGLARRDQEAVFVQIADAIEAALRPAPIEKEAVAVARLQPQDTLTPSNSRNGGGVASAHRSGKAWMLVGAGLAILLIFVWLLMPTKQEQTEMKVQAEHGVAAGGDINAKDITISAPQSAPPNAD